MLPKGQNKSVVTNPKEMEKFKLPSKKNQNNCHMSSELKTTTEQKSGKIIKEKLEYHKEIGTTKKNQ